MDQISIDFINSFFEPVPGDLNALLTAYCVIDLIYLQAITKYTADALDSDFWLGSSLKTVQEFLKLDNLNINEADLVRALVKWGKFQVRKDPEQAENLRDKILPAVPLIRFVGMSHKDVAKVCVEKLAAVLSAEEKIQIMHSCLVRKEYLLPPHLTRRPARRRPGSFSNLAGDWLITNLLQHSADKN
jgi:hypothetical protein